MDRFSYVNLMNDSTDRVRDVSSGFRQCFHMICHGDRRSHDIAEPVHGRVPSFDPHLEVAWPDLHVLSASGLHLSDELVHLALRHHRSNRGRGRGRLHVKVSIRVVGAGTPCVTFNFI